MLVTLAACTSDPTLEVVVQHPDGLAVASTDITVYESATLTCQDVEFSLLDDVQLQALATADEMISPGGAITGNLDGISRTNNKVIVARGYDASGDLVAAGCAQKALVSGKDSATISTVLAATVAIQPPADATVLATTVTATDPSGAVIDGRPISWTVYGPAGSVPSSTSNITVTSDGVWEPTMISHGGATLMSDTKWPSVVLMVTPTPYTYPWEGHAAAHAGSTPGSSGVRIEKGEPCGVM